MQLIFWIVFTALTIVPLWMLCPKYRLPSWVSLVAIAPIGAIALLWVFVYREDLIIPGIDK
ncbi:MAG: hypothetical protein AAGD04_14910 [Pseudomonadota bacterium]